MKNSKGPHVGDLPNIDVKEDATVSIEMKTRTVTLKKGVNSLLEQGGTALVIHANPDDHLQTPPVIPEIASPVVLLKGSNPLIIAFKALR